jgi:gliding motility-associated protein GldC
MTESNINIKVHLDADKVPQQISWRASDSSAEDPQPAKAMLLAFWDGIEKSALRIDLWTNEMMVDEMADFYCQLFISMADTFERATKHSEMTAEIKAFARQFYQKFVDIENEKNKPAEG